MIIRRIDYDEAAARYADRLDTKLRGFGDDTPWLATWVPDPDPVRGVLSLLEAAAGEGLDALEVVVDTLDPDALRARGRALGALQVEREGERWRVIATGLGDAATHAAETPAAPANRPARPAEPALVRPAEAPLHAAFRARAEALALDHAGHVAGEAIAVGDAEITLRIDGGVVRGAAHAGGGRWSQAAHEAFCRAVIGLPVEEALAHGVHRAMHRLLDPDAGRPVPGVMTPRNASPVFAALADAVGHFTRASALDDSTYAAAPSEAWRALSYDEKLARVRAALRVACDACGIAPEQVEAVSLQGDVRVQIDFADDVPVSRRRAVAMPLEAELQARVEPALRIEREARRDLSPLRRL